MSQSAPDHSSNGSMNDFNSDTSNSFPVAPMNQRFNSAFNSHSPMAQQQMMAERPEMSRVHSVPADVTSVDTFKTRNTPTVPSSHHPTTPVMIPNGSARNGQDISGGSSAPHISSEPGSHSNLSDMHLSRQALESQNKEITRQQQSQQQQPKTEDQGDYKLSQNPSRAPSINSQGHAGGGAASQGNTTPIGPGGPGVANNVRMGYPSPSMANQQEISAKMFKRNLGNAGVMRILDLIDLISSEPHASLSSVDFWARLCETYAASSAMVRIIMPPHDQLSFSDVKTDSGSSSPHGANIQSYRLNAATIPPFFVAAVRASDVSNYQISLPGIKFQVLNNGSVFMAAHFFSTFTFVDGSKGVASGDCRILLNRDFRIGSMEFKITNYESSMSISALERIWSNIDIKQEGADFMKKLLAGCKSEQVAKGAGFNDDALRLLRTSDIMCQLSPLMNFSMANNINSPLLALRKYVSMGGQGDINATMTKGGQGGAVSSPSPHTQMADEAKTTKKRRVSNSVNSPMSSGPIPSEQKR